MGCFIVNIIMSGRAHLLLMETKKEITPINRHCVIKDLSHCLTDFFVTNERNFDLETTIFFQVHCTAVMLAHIGAVKNICTINMILINHYGGEHLVSR